MWVRFKKWLKDVGGLSKDERKEAFKTRMAKHRALQRQKEMADPEGFKREKEEKRLAKFKRQRERQALTAFTQACRSLDGLTREKDHSPTDWTADKEAALRAVNEKCDRIIGNMTDPEVLKEMEVIRRVSGGIPFPMPPHD